MSLMTVVVEPTRGMGNDSIGASSVVAATGSFDIHINQMPKGQRIDIRTFFSIQRDNVELAIHRLSGEQFPAEDPCLGAKDRQTLG
jgi:hypothetical protein